MAAAPSSFSAAMERTNQWVFYQDIPTDIIVEVGDVEFRLHKFMLVAKSGYVRRAMTNVAGEEKDIGRVDATALPGGAAAFEKVASFCYGVNFQISVENVASLRCAAEFMEMTDGYAEGNLASRAESFLLHAAPMKTIPGAVAVLASCAPLLPMADDLRIVRRCIDSISLKVCDEIPTRSPQEWHWATELAELNPAFFQDVLAAMKCRGAPPQALAFAVGTYADKSLPGLLIPTHKFKTAALPPMTHGQSKTAIESLAGVLPPESDAQLSVTFLCRLLRAAIFLEASAACRRVIERRVSSVLSQASVGDLLTVAMDYAGERVSDLDSARRIVEVFVDKESGAGDLCGCSAAMRNVANTVDAFAAEIANDKGVSVSKFAGIAGSVPKSARRLDDDLYRAVDIYLKEHPGLDEIEKEKVCSVMDPLRLSYVARLHASQNKRLPLKIVLHALYYDQLKIRSGVAAAEPPTILQSSPSRTRVPPPQASDVELARENEALRAELARMKLYVSDMETLQGSGREGSSSGRISVAAAAEEEKLVRKKQKESSGGFLSSVTRTLGKLMNPLTGRRSGANGSEEETMSIKAAGAGEDAAVQPRRRRRFSMS